MKVSFYRKFDNVVPKTMSLYKVLDDIKNGKYKSQIKNVRLLINDKPKRDIEKKKLPLVGFGGVFYTRHNDKLKTPSGFAMLDFDHAADLSGLIKKVNSDKYTHSSFISPSGDGLKVLVKIPPVGSDKDYKAFYIKIQEHYDKYDKTDDATKDLCRATFFSYDPELYLNIDSSLFTDRFVHKEIVRKNVEVKLIDDNEIANRLIRWFKKKWTTGVNRNNNLFVLSSSFNDYGVSKSAALEYCMGYVSSDFRESEIKSLVDSAYKNIENFGTKAFEDKVKQKQIRKMVYTGVSKESIIKKVGSFDNIDTYIDKVSDSIDYNLFWDIDEKGKVTISFYRFDIYLKNKGISKYFQDPNSSVFDFITKDDNFINWIDTKRIKDIVKSDLITNGHIDIWDLMAGNTRYFSSEYLSMLDTIDVDYKKDTKTTSYLYYKNFAVQTTKNDIKLLEYKNIDSLIWQNQVIGRDIEISDESDGVFKTFIWKVSGENKDRYYTLKSVIGYLLHSYQNDSNPKVMIFNDEMISDDVPNGGSGKGLIHKAIGKIKNIIVEDGKKFDPSAQFAYQKVKRDTQIFLIDDVNKNFSFENLFSIATEGMTVEKKGKDPFEIPFNESPKISITTNYTIKGNGPSFNRRVFEVELANYFNDKHTPEDEFKHQFFSGWDENEWKRFDNFMIRCIQYFLKNGLMESEKVNLDYRKLKNNLGVEFIEFMESKDLSDFMQSRKEMRDDFNNQYKNISRYNTAQKFNSKVKEYCGYHKLVLSEAKNGGIIKFIITGGEPQKEEEILF